MLCSSRFKSEGASMRHSLRRPRHLRGAILATWSWALFASGCAPAPIEQELEARGFGWPSAADLVLDRTTPDGLTAHAGPLRVDLAFASWPSAAEARAFLAGERALLQGLFEPAVPPYPEFLTRELACPEALRPRETRHPLGTVTALAAGERFGFGICAPDLVRYRAAVGHFACGDRTLVARLFWPSNLACSEPSTRLADLGCP